MRALVALRQPPSRLGISIGRPAGARAGGLGLRPLTQLAVPSAQLQARGHTPSGHALVLVFSRRRALATAAEPHAGSQMLPAQRGVTGSSNSSKSLRQAVIATSSAADASGPIDGASPSQANGALLSSESDMATPADTGGTLPMSESSPEEVSP